MQRLFILFLVLFVVLPISTKAQENSRQPNGARNGSPEGSNSTVVSLLEQSHDLNPQSDLRVRINLLERQAEQMSRDSSRPSWLATPIITDLQANGRDAFVPGLAPLVQIGMQNDPDSTTTFVQSLPASLLKANLLLGAASALTMKTRLPIGSRELPKPEKSKY